MPKKPKPTPTSPESIEQARTWIAEGHSRAQIAEALASAFGQSADQQQATIDAAEAKLEAEAQAGLPLAWQLAAAREIYRRAIECNELGTALRALERCDRISAELKEQEEDDL